MRARPVRRLVRSLATHARAKARNVNTIRSVSPSSRSVRRWFVSTATGFKPAASRAAQFRSFVSGRRLLPVQTAVDPRYARGVMLRLTIAAAAVVGCACSTSSPSRPPCEANSGPCECRAAIDGHTYDMQCSDFYDQCTCTEDGRTTAVVNLVACDELDFL